MSAKPNSAKADLSGELQEIDVAIVGGGIAGLYCAFKLKQKFDDKKDKKNKQFRAEFKQKEPNKIVLFEASPRLGGRICTLIPGSTTEKKNTRANLTKLEFYAEFGPMRIEKDQKLLHDLLSELGIAEKVDQRKPHLVPFPAFGSPVSRREPKYELVGAEKDQETPWDLMFLAFARIITGLSVAPTSGQEESSQGKSKERVRKERECLQEQLNTALRSLERAGSPVLADPSLWKRNLEKWIGGLKEEHYQNLREYAMFDGECLWNIGFWNLLSDVLSHDAVMKLRDLGTFYHLIPENPNAAEWLIFWLRNIKGSKHLQGVYGGMKCITAELGNRLRKKGLKVEVKTKRKLIAIEPDKKDANRVVLTFEETSEAKGEKPKVQCSARQVILALPKAPLAKLALTNRQHFAEEIIKDLDAVFGFPMVKLFVVVKRRWWEEEYRANLYATRIPTRELHYWKSLQAGSKKGMVMMYTDRPASSFWANYIKQTGEQDWPEHWPEDEKASGTEQNKRLIKKILQYLRENEVENISEDDIEWYGIRDWGREPYLGANHAWRPERKSWEVLKALSRFHLTRSEASEANVHICGEAYSDYHGFIEGSLRSSSHVLHVMYRSYFQTETPWLCVECKDCLSCTLRQEG